MLFHDSIWIFWFYTIICLSNLLKNTSKSHIIFHYLISGFWPAHSGKFILNNPGKIHRSLEIPPFGRDFRHDFVVWERRDLASFALLFSEPVWRHLKVKGYKNWSKLGRGQVVSVVAFYSDDPSSNPAEVYRFDSVNCLKITENKLERGWGWPIKKYQNATAYCAVIVGLNWYLTTSMAGLSTIIE